MQVTQTAHTVKLTELFHKYLFIDETCITQRYTLNFPARVAGFIRLN